MGRLEKESSPERPPEAAFTAAAVRRELTRGKELLAELQALLQAEASPAAGSLVQDALGSITRALSVLDMPQKLEEAAEAPAVPLPPPASCFGGQESKKRKIQQPRRSGYRRRSHPYDCRKTISKTMDDGYTWRKYGQKEIHGSKYPRNYFRCTYKYDRHCQATRQIQLSEEDPSMFVITYLGEHTCIMCSSESPLRQGTSTRIIDFSSHTSAAAGPPFSSSASAMKQESEEEAVSSLTVDGSSSPELLPVFAELTEIQGSVQVDHFTTLAGQCDVTSDLQYSSSADFMISTDTFDLDAVFNFAEDGSSSK